MGRKRCYVWDLSKDEIQARVNACFTMSEVLVEFGFSKTSGTMRSILKNIFSEYEIDTSHFDSRHYMTDPKFKMSKIPLEDILVKNSTYTNMASLKKRLLAEGYLKYVCAKCGNTGIWQNEVLALHLEHIDGDHFNNELDNLCFLCPNCHSQTETFGSRNRKTYRKKCKKDQFRCVDRINSGVCPSKAVLEQLLANYSYSEIGRQHSVSSNTVKKWAKRYGLYKPVFNTMPKKHILEAQLKQCTVSDLAKSYGVCTGTIRYWIGRLGCELRSPLMIYCVELDREFNNKADAARYLFPELSTAYAAHQIQLCCDSGKAFHGYHWKRC